MAGKRVVFASGRVAYALDHLSKSALADVLLTRVLAEPGMADATDSQILALLQKWIDQPLTVRRERVPNLAALAARYMG